MHMRRASGHVHAVSQREADEGGSVGHANFTIIRERYVSMVLRESESRSAMAALEDPATMWRNISRSRVLKRSRGSVGNVEATHH